MFRSLSVRNYRLFAGGQTVSLVGTWMQMTTQDWLVVALGGGGMALGITLGLQFGPMLVVGLYGGVVADRSDKRRLLLVTQAAYMLLALTMCLLVASGAVTLGVVYAFAATVGLVAAFDTPARQAFVSEMVGPELLPNAVALNSITFNSARVVGPAGAGVLIGVMGTMPGATLVFGVNAASYLAAIAALLLIRPGELFPSRPAERAGDRGPQHPQVSTSGAADAAAAGAAPSTGTPVPTPNTPLLPDDAVHHRAGGNADSVGIADPAGTAGGNGLARVAGVAGVAVAGDSGGGGQATSDRLQRPEKWAKPSGRGGQTLDDLRDGLRYVAGNRSIATPILLVSVVGALGLNFPVTMTLMASETFGGTAATYGMLTATLAAGGIIGAGVSARRREPPRPSTLVGAAAAFGFFETLAAAMPTLPTFVAATAVMGAAVLMFTTTANTTVQLAADPAMRGRVMAVYILVFLGTTPIGAPIVGALSEAAGPRVGLAVGGVSCLLAAAAAAVSHRRCDRTATSGHLVRAGGGSS